MGQELVQYHAEFAPLFVRREQRGLSLQFLQGQLSDLERKTVEPMVARLSGPDPNRIRAMQNFLGNGAWSDARIVARHQELVAAGLGQSEGHLILDGSGFPKQGTRSVGVARQYCGLLGKVANSQHGVFAIYSTPRGATLLDYRLYMPQRWFTPEYAARRVDCQVPAELTFQTEPELAWQMVEHLLAAAVVPFLWVLGDETYGRDPQLMDRIDAAGKLYFFEIPLTTQLWLGTPPVDPPGPTPAGQVRKYPRARVAPRTAKQLGSELEPKAWTRYCVREGARGPQDLCVAALAVTRPRRHQGPGPQVRLVFRRNADQTGLLRAFLTNAPMSCSLRKLARMTASRWPIETVFEEAKSELGMDHYEVRSWRGWHHQMTLSMLTHHFLVRMRQRQKKSSPRTHLPPSTAPARIRAAPSTAHP
jgi:SRSO17 transposase